MVAALFAVLNDWKKKKEIVMHENREKAKLTGTLKHGLDTQSNMAKKHNPHMPVKLAEPTVSVVPPGGIPVSSGNEALRERLEHLDKELAAIRAHLLIQSADGIADETEGSLTGGGSVPTSGINTTASSAVASEASETTPRGAEGAEGADGAESAEGSESTVSNAKNNLGITGNIIAAILYMRSTTFRELGEYLYETGRVQAVKVFEEVKAEVEATMETIKLHWDDDTIPRTMSKLLSITEFSFSVMWNSIVESASYTLEDLYSLLDGKKRTSIPPPPEDVNLDMGVDGDVPKDSVSVAGGGDDAESALSQAVEATIEVDSSPLPRSPPSSHSQKNQALKGLVTPSVTIKESTAFTSTETVLPSAVTESKAAADDKSSPEREVAASDNISALPESDSHSLTPPRRRVWWRLWT